MNTQQKINSVSAQLDALRTQRRQLIQQTRDTARCGELVEAEALYRKANELLPELQKTALRLHALFFSMEVDKQVEALAKKGQTC